MFGKRPKLHSGALALPVEISSDEKAAEILRLWIRSDGANIAVLKPDALADPAMWGLLLADVARHVADALASSRDGDSKATLDRVRKGFDAEMANPTDVPSGSWSA